MSRTSSSSILTFLACGLAALATASQSSQSAHAADAPLTLAVRVVGLQNESGKTTLNPDSAARMLQNVNKMYTDAGCAIQFKLDSFTAANPKDTGLEYNTSDMGELDKYRDAFDDGKSLLVVDTGPWSENMHPANAWTAMPGSPRMGAIFEASVASFHQIVGHELGHYLGLDHITDDHNMMNPVIEDFSTAVSAEQCTAMREVASTTLKAALR